MPAYRGQVSEWKPCDAVFDSAASRESDVAERTGGAGDWIVQRKVEHLDQLAGDEDQRDGLAGWEPD
jgi:hypothetical protein